MTSSKKIKLVVSDMDGTFLLDDGSISSENKQAVADLRRAGIPFVFATGRMLPMLEVYAHQLHLDGLLVAYNGGLVAEAKTGRIMYKQPIDKHVVSTLVQLFLHHSVDFLVYTQDRLFYPAQSERIQVFHRYNSIARSFARPQIPLYPIEDYLAQQDSLEVLKLLVQDFDEQRREMLAHQMREIREIHFEPSMPALFDIMACGVTKGSAVPILCDYYHLDADEICAFGDQQNDMSLFKACGTSFCMENGAQSLKSIATHITISNNQSGFAHAVYQHILT